MGIWMVSCNILFRYRVTRNRTLLGQKCGIKVYITEIIGSPCLLGIFHPSIYLTPDSAKNEKHKQYSITHELTHYRHGDHIWTFLRNLCLVIYWFNPLVWIGACLADRDCELACDEGVLSQLNENQSQEYGCTLIEMAAFSVKKQKLLHCETGMAFGKKELMERITYIAKGKKNVGLLAAILVIACGAGLAACTFGGTKSEPAMGRYVETSVELPGIKKEYLSLVQNGETIRLLAAAGADIISVDGGATFECVDSKDMPSGVSSLYSRNVNNIAGSTGGARIFQTYTSIQDYKKTTFLITDKGEEIQLKALGDNYAYSFYSNGFFYICEQDFSENRYYKADPSTGEIQLLIETTEASNYIVAGETYLYLVNKSGNILLYDMKTGELAVEQDQVLSDFAVEHATSIETYPLLLYPYKEGVYILSHKGLYWHELYGETVEQVIDGGFCSIGNIEKHFNGMVLRETEGKPEFLIFYNENEIMRYTYDASLPSVPEALRVYSVYEDSLVIKAVNAFRAQHPEIPVLYESGMNSGYASTIDDVLKNLATEIASGNGPNILVMDDIPFESYAEKGVLADLSGIREGMAEEDWFVNVIDAFAREDHLYAIPMSFSVPVLGGKEGKITGLETLADLADMLEKEKAESGKEYVFCTWDAESTLHLLSQSSQGAWMDGETFNKEEVTEFLTQAKRIYDLQMNENMKPAYCFQKHNLVTPSLWIGDYISYPLARRFDSDGAFCMVDKRVTFGDENEADCYAGFISGNERDFMFFYGYQDYYGETYVRMPGQQYGTCLVSSLLAINSNTQYEQESKLFLEYAISFDFFKEDTVVNGTPINREAYLSKQNTGEGEKRSYWNGLGTNDSQGNYFNLTIKWPTTEDYDKLNNLLDGVTGVNICDPVVYEAVMEYGEKALTGESSIEDAVNAIEKRLKIYLAE